MAIDTCDPTAFNAALRPDFCRNVTFAALGQAMTLSDPFSQEAAGTPNPVWDFAPDAVSVVRLTPVSVANHGGEPHTFTEVQKFVGVHPRPQRRTRRRPRVRQRFRQSEGRDHPSAAGQPVSDNGPVEGKPTTSSAASIHGCVRKSS